MEMSVISSSWDNTYQLAERFRSLVGKQFVPEDLRFLGTNDEMDHPVRRGNEEAVEFFP